MTFADSDDRMHDCSVRRGFHLRVSHDVIRIAQMQRDCS
jgi:hypothetical protein